MPRFFARFASLRVRTYKVGGARAGGGDDRRPTLARLRRQGLPRPRLGRTGGLHFGTEEGRDPCAAIEPVIGHMKSDGRLARRPLKGTEGDMFHAIMCGCGQNIRMILRWIQKGRGKIERGKAEKPLHANGAAPI